MTSGLTKSPHLVHEVEQQLCGAGRNPVASRIDTGRPHYRLRPSLGARPSANGPKFIPASAVREPASTERA